MKMQVVSMLVLIVIASILSSSNANPVEDARCRSIALAQGMSAEKVKEFRKFFYFSNFGMKDMMCANQCAGVFLETFFEVNGGVGCCCATK